MRDVLDRLVAADPDPEDWESCVSRIIAEIGDPEGPTRSVAMLLGEAWRNACDVPGFWEFLLRQAIARDPSSPSLGPLDPSGR